MIKKCRNGLVRLLVFCLLSAAVTACGQNTAEPVTGSGSQQDDIQTNTDGTDSEATSGAGLPSEVSGEEAGIPQAYAMEQETVPDDELPETEGTVEPGQNPGGTDSGSLSGAVSESAVSGEEAGVPQAYMMEQETVLDDTLPETEGAVEIWKEPDRTDGKKEKQERQKFPEICHTMEQVCLLAEASEDSAILCQLPAGTEVRKGREEGNWSYVLDENGRTGYILTSYLTD